LWSKQENKKKILIVYSNKIEFREIKENVYEDKIEKKLRKVYRFDTEKKKEEEKPLSAILL